MLLYPESWLKPAIKAAMSRPTTSVNERSP
jgi:hypothetical protein